MEQNTNETRKQHWTAILNECSSSGIGVILSMQDQLTQLNANLERLIEQIASANNKRYGRSSEKLDVIAEQLELELIFNELEKTVEGLYVVEPPEDVVIEVRRRKQKRKREEDLKARAVSRNAL